MIFKKLKNKKNNIKLSKSSKSNSPIFKKIHSQKNISTKFKGYYKGLPIYSYKFIKFSQTELFRGDEVTYISKPCIVFVLNSKVKYRGINTILHEIKYVGDKNKTCKIRLQIGNVYSEILLGDNKFETLYFCKNAYSDYVTYREKYADKIVKPPKQAYTKILKHYYCRETFKYLGEML